MREVYGPFLSLAGGYVFTINGQKSIMAGVDLNYHAGGEPTLYGSFVRGSSKMLNTTVQITGLFKGNPTKSTVVGGGVSLISWTEEMTLYDNGGAKYFFSGSGKVAGLHLIAASEGTTGTSFSGALLTITGGDPDLGGLTLFVGYRF